MTLHDAAKSLTWTDLLSTNKQDRSMTLAWWHFLRTMDPAKVLAIFDAAVPEKCKVVLGGPLDRRELLNLPANWEDKTFWGVYVDVLTGSGIKGSDMIPYVGSGTEEKSCKGISSRLKTYTGVKAGRIKPHEHNKHFDTFLRKDVNMNLRIVAAFARSAATPPAYVLLFEQVVSILLRTQRETSSYLSPSTLRIIQRATPAGLAPPSYPSLNRAAQIRQTLRRPTTGVLKCARPQCGTTDTSGWHSATRGLPQMSVICSACYYYELNNPGKQRTKEHEEVRQEAKMFLEANPELKEKPADGLCQRCHQVPEQWRVSVSRTRWECQKCVQITTDEIDPQPVHIKRPKGTNYPTDDKVLCPRCGRKPRRRKSGTARDWNWSKYRGRPECRNCYLSKKARPNGTTPKPADDLCPRCRRKPKRWRRSPIRDRMECTDCHQSRSSKPSYQLKTKR